jgi:hypothetical protein
LGWQRRKRLVGTGEGEPAGLRAQQVRDDEVQHQDRHAHPGRHVHFIEPVSVQDQAWPASHAAPIWDGHLDVAAVGCGGATVQRGRGLSGQDPLPSHQEQRRGGPCLQSSGSVPGYEDASPRLIQEPVTESHPHRVLTEPGYQITAEVGTVQCVIHAARMRCVLPALAPERRICG